MRIKRYRGVWCVYWREGGRSRRVSLGTTDRGEAERLLRDFQQDQQRKGPLETVGQIVEAYLNDREDRRSPSVASHRSHWTRMSQTFADLAPRHITRALSRDYIAACRSAGQSDGTIRTRLAILSAALRWHDPHHDAVVEMPPVPAPRDRYLTRSEAERLLEAARQTPHIHLFTVLALTTAARASALLQLTWDRVDLDRSVIDLGSGRGHKRRAVVPINETARQAILCAREAAESGYVIEYAGGPVASVKKAFGRACERAELDGVSPHVLRHTAAVWMAEAGVPMSEISQYLGHTSTTVTERVYARYSPDYQRRAASALEIGGGSNEPPSIVSRRRKSLI